MAHLRAGDRAVRCRNDGRVARRCGPPFQDNGAGGQRWQRRSLAARGSLLNNKVLVADDDESLVRTLTWILKEHGYEVSVCPGGDGLFAKLEEIKRELLARVEAHIRVGRALAQAREEARSRAAMVDILHEVTDSLKPDEIYHILARRVARVLNISKCSMVLAKAGDETGVVVAAYENPMLRNLQIELARYPEIRQALTTGRLVLVEDVSTDPLYKEERLRWEKDGIKVPTRSAVALPFWMKDQQMGVFFLRTTGDDPPLTRADAQFGETV